MADTILSIANGNIYIKASTTQEVLLILAAAEQHILKVEDIIDLAVLEERTEPLASPEESFVILEDKEE